MKMKKAIQRAVQIVGSPLQLAIYCNVARPQIYKWLTTGIVPPRRVLDIEKATKGKVKRWELRPDIYPPEDY